jgi:hypothetical protein
MKPRCELADDITVFAQLIPGQIRKRQTGLTIISKLITKFPPYTHQMPAKASS